MVQKISGKWIKENIVNPLKPIMKEAYTQHRYVRLKANGKSLKFMARCYNVFFIKEVPYSGDVFDVEIEFNKLKDVILEENAFHYNKDEGRFLINGITIHSRKPHIEECEQPIDWDKILTFPKGFVKRNLRYIMNYYDGIVLGRRLDEILFDEVDGKLRVVATDGHILGLEDTTYTFTVNEPFTIPHYLVKALINSSDEEFVFRYSYAENTININNYLYFNVGYDFPQYECVIPETFAYSVNVTVTRELVNKLKTIVKTQTYNPVVYLDEDGIHTDHHGKYPLAVNPRLLIRIFNDKEIENVVFHVKGKEEQIGVQVYGKPYFKGLLMPYTNTELSDWRLEQKVGWLPPEKLMVPKKQKTRRKPSKTSYISYLKGLIKGDLHKCKNCGYETVIKEGKCTFCGAEV